MDITSFYICLIVVVASYSDGLLGLEENDLDRVSPINNSKSFPTTILSKTDNTHSSHVFNIFWNAKTQNCKHQYSVDVNVQQYGILENKEDGWKGNVITIFPQEQLGYYPFVSKNGTLINGGIPQKVNLTAHLEKMKKDIHLLLDDAFSGLAVIDWEGWRPLWKRNWDQLSVYKKLSIAYVKNRHPYWNQTQLESVAKVEFETSARKMITATVHLARSLRRNAKWGFYHYSDCFKYEYQNRTLPDCTTEDQKLNDRLLWLFNELSGTYPSCYVYAKHNTTFNYDYIYTQIAEQLRITKLLENDLPVYPYGRLRYNDVTVFQESFYKLLDIVSTITLPVVTGAYGVVFWDDNLLQKSPESCHTTKEYVDSIIGPLASAVINSSVHCSRSKCNGRRCFISLNKKIKLVFENLISDFFKDMEDMYDSTNVPRNESIRSVKSTTNMYTERLRKWDIFSLMENQNIHAECG